MQPSPFSPYIIYLPHSLTQLLTHSFIQSPTPLIHSPLIRPSLTHHLLLIHSFITHHSPIYPPIINFPWPCLDLDPGTGAFVEDIYEGKCVSKLTCLIYLNGAKTRASSRANNSSSGDNNNSNSGSEGNGGKDEGDDDEDDDDDFEGGYTTFYQPHPTTLGHIDARGVQPTTGAILCFPHGEIGSLVHEGSAVAGRSRKAKYVIRTDVIYEC